MMPKPWDKDCPQCDIIEPGTPGEAEAWKVVANYWYKMAMIEEYYANKMRRSGYFFFGAIIAINIIQVINLLVHVIK